MRIWQKILIPTAIVLLVSGTYLFFVWKHRQNPGVVGRQNQPEQPRSLDDVAVVRILSPAHFDDVTPLAGTSVWMKDGYAMPYFTYAGGRVEFNQRIGLIPAAQQLDVKKIVKQAAPASVDDNVQHDGRQVFAVFTLPGGKDPFATPIGYINGHDEAYYTDMLFYYDDPHKIYSNWPKDVWAAIDAHQVKPGMSELETQMSIGEKLHPDGPTEGDRTVTYDQNGKQWKITYVDNHATQIKTGQATLGSISQKQGMLQCASSISIVMQCSPVSSHCSMSSASRFQPTKPANLPPGDCAGVGASPSPVSAL